MATAAGTCDGAVTDVEDAMVEAKAPRRRLRALTFNVLAPLWADACAGWYNQRDVRMELMPLEHRLPRILATIKRAEPDLVRQPTVVSRALSLSRSPCRPCRADMSPRRRQGA